MRPRTRVRESLRRSRNHASNHPHQVKGRNCSLILTAFLFGSPNWKREQPAPRGCAGAVGWKAGGNSLSPGREKGGNTNVCRPLSGENGMRFPIFFYVVWVKLWARYSGAWCDRAGGPDSDKTLGIYVECTFGILLLFTWYYLSVRRIQIPEVTANTAVGNDLS